jgi:hypothetical protein
MRKLITVFALSMLLTACGGGGGGNDNTDATDSNSNADNTNSNSETVNNNDSNPTQSAVLVGNTWNLCNQFTGSSTQFPQVFTETEYFAMYNTFTNNSCSGSPYTASEITSGTYTLGNTVVTSGGFSATEIDFHVTSAFGAPLPPADQYTLYDIYYVDNDTLYYGDVRAESAAERPETINFDDAYIKEN